LSRIGLFMHPMGMVSGIDRERVDDRGGNRAYPSGPETMSSRRSRVGMNPFFSTAKVVGPVLRMPSMHRERMLAGWPLSMVRRKVPMGPCQVVAVVRT